jgi:hypothetical protein
MKSVSKSVRGSIAIVVLIVQSWCSNAYADCWGTKSVNCQFGGPAYYQCDGTYYPVLMFNNSGTYELATPAYEGVDGMEGAVYHTCTYSFRYVCHGRIYDIERGYDQDGSHAIGRPCAIAMLRRDVSVVLALLKGAW